MLAGCGSLFPPSYRFRLTVEVDTSQGVRSGSSVLEVTSQLQNLPGKGIVPLTSLTGEAVALDLPGGKTLFALIGRLASGRDAPGRVTNLFEPGGVGPEAFVQSVKKLAAPIRWGASPAFPPSITLSSSPSATLPIPSLSSRLTRIISPQPSARA
jgi:hypothetical protein